MKVTKKKKPVKRTKNCDHSLSRYRYFRTSYGDVYKIAYCKCGKFVDDIATRCE